MATYNHSTATLPTLSSVRRDIGQVNEKIESISEKLDVLRTGLNPIPVRVQDIESDMAAREHQLDDLEYRNKVHSARLKLLQKELEYVKLENDMMLGRAADDQGGRYHGGDAYGGPSHDDGQGGYGVPMRMDREGYGQGGQMEHMRLDSQDRRPMAANGARTPRNNDNHLYQQQEQQQQQQQLQHQQSNRAEAQPNGNMNTTNNNVEKQDEGKSKFDLEREKRENRRKIYSSFDSTAINPQRWDKTPEVKMRYDHTTHPYPGGLVFIRYHDSGFPVVRDSITRMLSICRHSGGYLMGSARKESILVFETVPSKQQNWRVARQQPYKDKLTTENAITVFWFSKQKAAEEFFDNTHKNPFREPCYPTADGYEAFYVPLQTAPPMKSLNSFLFLEFLDSRQYRAEDLTQFEAEARQDMQRLVPGCQSMVVSSREGRVVFKPGSFISPYSKLYISRFESLNDAEMIWNSGLIQGIRQRWNLHGAINVFAFTIQDSY